MSIIDDRLICANDDVISRNEVQKKSIPTESNSGEAPIKEEYKKFYLLDGTPLDSVLGDRELIETEGNIYINCKESIPNNTNSLIQLLQRYNIYDTTKFKLVLDKKYNDSISDLILLYQGEKMLNHSIRVINNSRNEIVNILTPYRMHPMYIEDTGCMANSQIFDFNKFGFDSTINWTQLKGGYLYKNDSLILVSRFISNDIYEPKIATFSRNTSDFIFEESTKQCLYSEYKNIVVKTYNYGNQSIYAQEFSNNTVKLQDLTRGKGIYSYFMGADNYSIASMYSKSAVQNGIKLMSNLSINSIGNMWLDKNITFPTYQFDILDNNKVPIYSFSSGYYTKLPLMNRKCYPLLTNQCELSVYRKANKSYQKVGTQILATDSPIVNFQNGNFSGKYYIQDCGMPVLDQFWIAQKTYDFYKNHNITSSIDFKPIELVFFTHDIDKCTYRSVDLNKRMILTSFSSDLKPFTKFDLISHELGHGVIEFNIAGGSFVNDLGESDALEEAIADILALSAEYSESFNTFNWSIGENVLPVNAIRYLSNPLKNGKPDTYKGLYWNWNARVDKDVHRNSTVIGKWFYLFVNGGSGNTHYPLSFRNYNYNVNGVGMQKAISIISKVLKDGTLTSNSKFKDFVISVLEVCQQNYGVNSSEFIAACNAFYAVGLLSTSSSFCSGRTELTSPNSTFSDGSLSFQYKNNSNCEWLIKPAGASTITLEFSEFLLATDDTVIVYDGPSVSSTVKLKATGTNIPTSISSTGSSMLVKFKSNSSNVHEGFTAKYTANINTSNCGDYTLVSKKSGTVTDGSGGSNYNNNTNCKWLISPPGADSLKFVFNSFSTESGVDKFYIYQGDSLTGNYYGPFSGTTIPNGFTIPSGRAYAVFESDEKNTSSGWSVTYTSYGNVYCDDTTLLTNSSDTFSDGSGPIKNYHNNSDCKWLIKPSGAKSIKINIDSFDLENASSDGKVIYDYVSIYDGPNSGSPLIAKLTGSGNSEVIVTTGDEAFIHFHSDNTTNAKGFQISYESFNSGYCSGTRTLSSSSGTISDQSDTAKYGVNADCRWLISPKNATSIVFKMKSMSMDTLGDGVILYDGPNVNSPILAMYFGDSISNDSVYSSNGQMLVRFITNDTITQFDSGFLAEYYAVIDSSGSNNSIVGYEYWFDGNDSSKVFVKCVPGTDLKIFRNIETTNIGEGLHVINMRYLDRYDQWSVIHSDYFRKVSRPDTGFGKNLVQYWFNDNSKNLLLVDSSNLISQRLNTDSLNEGLNLIHLRGVNSRGQWSSILTECVNKMIPDSLAIFDSWIDTNKQFFTTVKYTPYTSYRNIDTSIKLFELNKGNHQFYSRFRSKKGLWSALINDTFIKKGLFLLDTVFNPICANDSLEVTISRFGIFDSTSVFNIQLSDTSGKFNNAFTIGSKTKVHGNGKMKIPTLIPSGSTSSSNYKLRVISTNSDDTSNISGYFTINKDPRSELLLIGKENFCLGDSVILKTIVSDSQAYQWYKNDTALILENDSTLIVRTAGKYRYKVVNNRNCKAYSNDTFIEVYPRVDLKYSLNNDSQCLNNNLFEFEDKSSISDGTYSVNWDFGDGSSFDSTFAAKRYIDSGTYFAYFKVNTDNYCSDSVKINVRVKYMPKVEFTLSDSVQCYKYNNFTLFDQTDSSKISIFRNWNIDEVDYGQSINLIVNFQDTGIHIAKLKINTAESCIDSSQKTLKVLQMPVPAISSNHDTDCFKYNNFTIKDNTESKGLTYNIKWNLDDGTFDTTNTIVKHFMFDGNYIVQLLVESIDGCRDTAEKELIVFPMPIPSLTTNSNGQCLYNNEFNFKNTTDSNKVKFKTIWKFGDGDSSFTSNVLKSYDQADTFINWMILTTRENCIDTLSSSVIVFPTPVAIIGVDSIERCLNINKTRLFDKSSIQYGNLDRIWDFGNGITSNIIDTTIQYGNWGEYKVRIVSISQENCTDTSFQVISIKPNPQSEFTVNDSQQCLNTNSFNFVNLSTVPYGDLSYSWDFGDSGSSSDTTPIYAYSKAGKYRSILVAKSNYDCIDSTELELMVFKIPDVSIKNSGDSLFCLGDSVTLTAIGGINYVWNTNDSGSMIVVKTSGNFKVTGIDSNGCSNISESIKIEVNLLPIKPVITNFNNTRLVSSYIKGNQWYRNDTILTGETDSVLPIIVKGIFKVSHTDSFGCTSFSDSIIISRLNSVDYLKYNKYWFYPNPVESTLIIELQYPEIIKGSIFDAIGKEIKSFESNGFQTHFELDLFEFKPGIYYLHVNDRIYIISKL